MTKPVLIVGGGPAGLAAAHSLGSVGRECIIVEKEDRLGGAPILSGYAKLVPTGEWAKDAIGGMVERVENESNVKVVTGAKVSSFDGTPGNFTAALSNGDTIETDSAILCTGFTHFDSVNKPEWGFGTHADVVTTTTHKTLRGPRSGLILARANEALEKQFNSAIFPGAQGGPLMHVIAAKAVAFKEAMSPDFVAYQEQVIRNAQAMAETFVANGHKIVSGGTDNHLMLLDLIGKEYTGKDADAALGEAYITVNKNAVPNDPRSPFVTSGLRLGTPAITTRGFGVAETEQLTGWICEVLASLEAGTSDQVIPVVREQVKALCATLPVYAR